MLTKSKKKKTTSRFWFVDSKKNHKHIFHYQKFWVFLIWKSIYFINCDFVCSKRFFSVFSALSIHLTFPSRGRLDGRTWYKFWYHFRNVKPNYSTIIKVRLNLLIYQFFDTIFLKISLSLVGQSLQDCIGFEQNERSLLLQLGLISVTLLVGNEEMLGFTDTFLLVIILRSTTTHLPVKVFGSTLVLGRDPKSPKARTFKVKPDGPEPEVCWILQARSGPSPNLKPAGTRRSFQ